MDNMIINQTEIQLNKANIEKMIDSEIVSVNEKYYKKLKNAFHNSKGDYVEKMKLQVEEEYKMVSELANLYREILQYIQEAANQAELLDQGFSKEKIQWGDMTWPD